MRLTVAVVVSLSAVACQEGKTEEQQKVVTPPPPEPAPPLRAPRMPLPEAMPPDAIQWQQHATETGLSFDVMLGVDTQTGEMSGNFYTRQEKRPVTIAVWSGQGRTLDHWRRSQSPKAEFGAESSIELCGQKATRQEAKIPGATVQVGGAGESLSNNVLKDLPGGPPPEPKAPTTAPSPADKKLRDIPARTVVVVGFEQKGTPILASWAVETDQREAFRKAEEHFFASLRCQ
jgi:hypothetical protein